jgi:mRNA interferase MazF
MPKTVWATFLQGKVELSEPITVPDGTRILVTILPDDESEFWLKASQTLVRLPFSDLSGSKIRPAVVVNAEHISKDLIIVPLTSKTSLLLEGEFILSEWAVAGLNIETAVKRGLYTVHKSMVVKTIGKLADSDVEELDRSIQLWLGL